MNIHFFAQTVFYILLPLLAFSDDDRLFPLQKYDNFVEQQTNNNTIQLFDQITADEWLQKNYHNSNIEINNTISKKSLEDYSINWQVSIESSSINQGKHINKSTPIIKNNIIYTVNSSNTVYAIDMIKDYSQAQLPIKTKKILWSKSIYPKYTINSSSGGIAWHDNKIIVSTGLSEVLALDYKTGNILWRNKIISPIRSAPKIYKNYVVVQDVKRNVFCFNAITGKKLWAATGNLLLNIHSTSTGEVAITDNMVIAGLSEREVVAIDIETGNIIWNKNLSNAQQANRRDVFQYKAIVASIAIYRGHVYVASTIDAITKINLKTGNIVWVSNIASQFKPIINGNALFILTDKNRLHALNLNNGETIWAKQLLPKQDKKFWYSPLLASNKIILNSMYGDMLKIDAYTGKILENNNTLFYIYNKPILVNNIFYFLTKKGGLVSYY